MSFTNYFFRTRWIFPYIIRSYKCCVRFLIFKTNYFWSNRGIVCLIISVLGPTQTLNILHEKKFFSEKIKKFFVEISKIVFKKKLTRLVKTYSFLPYKTYMVNPAVKILYQIGSIPCSYLMSNFSLTETSMVCPPSKSKILSHLQKRLH